MRQASAWVDTTTLTGNDRNLLAAICDHASGDYGTCFASQKRLGWDCGGVSREVVSRTIKRLEEGNENGPYIQRLGVHESGTLLLRPCFERPDDRPPNPPKRCDDSSQPLFIVKPDGQAVFGGCDESSHVTKDHTKRVNTSKAKAVSGEKENEQSTDSNNARAKKSLTELDYAREFENEFWSAWPTGRKANKPGALKAFTAARRRGASLDEILAGLGRAIVAWKANNSIITKSGRDVATQFVPHPQTWIKAEGWNDEHPTVADGPGLESVKGSTDAGQSKGEKWSGGKS